MRTTSSSDGDPESPLEGPPFREGHELLDGRIDVVERAMTIVERLGDGPARVVATVEQPQAQHVALGLVVGAIGEGVPAVHDAEVVDEEHVADLLVEAEAVSSGRCEQAVEGEQLRASQRRRVRPQRIPWVARDEGPAKVDLGFAVDLCHDRPLHRRAGPRPVGDAGLLPVPSLRQAGQNARLLLHQGVVHAPEARQVLVPARGAHVLGEHGEDAAGIGIGVKTLMCVTIRVA